jgi:hypothetical protein
MSFAEPGAVLRVSYGKRGPQQRLLFAYALLGTVKALAIRERYVHDVLVLAKVIFCDLQSRRHGQDVAYVLTGHPSPPRCVIGPISV